MRVGREMNTTYCLPQSNAGLYGVSECCDNFCILSSGSQARCKALTNYYADDTSRGIEKKTNFCLSS